MCACAHRQYSTVVVEQCTHLNDEFALSRVLSKEGNDIVVLKVERRHAVHFEDVVTCFDVHLGRFDSTSGVNLVRAAPVCQQMQQNS